MSVVWVEPVVGVSLFLLFLQVGLLPGLGCNGSKLQSCLFFNLVGVVGVGNLFHIVHGSLSQICLWDHWMAFMFSKT